MIQTPLHTAILVTGSVVGACCLLVSACSKGAETRTAMTTATAAATASARVTAPSVPTIVAQNNTAHDPAHDIAKTAAVSPPGNPNGTLPLTPGEPRTAPTPH